MSGDTTSAGSSSLDPILELMERALIGLKALDRTIAAEQLYDAIETAMDSPEGRPRPGEIWDIVYDFPHIVQRTFLLHRRDGLSIDHVARRLGITVQDARVHLAFAEREVSTPRPSGRYS
ncbi:hypothetical protein PX699_27185 [Sphingobium sp. H39-3-25]|uniref:hypothetical protein n=1 Tax=Sphingobium arseniciresistens TaxID=3030834 RepID=UPI0023B8B00E|nr:hypothetical protein [Sphingobium arseniciresistens]